MIIFFCILIYIVSVAAIVAFNRKGILAVEFWFIVFPVMNSLIALGTLILSLCAALDRNKIWRRFLVRCHKIIMWLENKPKFGKGKRLFLWKGDKFITKSGEVKVFNGKISWIKYKGETWPLYCCEGEYPLRYDSENIYYAS
jgi:hypothetical protein